MHFSGIFCCLLDHPKAVKNQKIWNLFFLRNTIESFLLTLGIELIIKINYLIFYFSYKAESIEILFPLNSGPFSSCVSANVEIRKTLQNGTKILLLI